VGEQSKWGSVLVKVSVKVVGEEIVELVTSEDIGAGVQHGTTWKVFINGWIFSSVELVHDHFPNSMGSCWTTLEVSVASVGHLEVHSVWPEWRILKWGSDRGIIQETLFLHHSKLVVPTNSKIWSTESNNGVVLNWGELFNDKPGSSHFSGPVIHLGIRPEGLIIIVGNGVGSNLMTKSMHVLDSGVVCIVMGNEEGGFDVTTIRVLSLLVEDFLIEVNVANIDSIIKGECDHLGNSCTSVILGTKISGDLSSIFRTETVWESAEGFITWGSTVGVSVSITNIFIGSILAILFTIAEEILCDTDSITTSQFIGSLAERLVSHQERLCFLLSCKFITVLHSPLPVTCLLLKIKCKSWGTSDGLQSSSSALYDITAVI